MTSFPSIDPDAGLTHFQTLIEEGCKKFREDPATSAEDESLNRSFTGSTHSEGTGQDYK